MNIRQLEYLYEIIRCRSFSEAAKKLYVAQPAVSMAVKQLEEELGVELINRTMKPVCLTPEGELVFTHVEKILEQVNDLQNEIDDIKGLRTGNVHIGIPEMLGNYYFAETLAGFKKKHPAIRMTIESEPSNRIKQKIMTGEIDMGIISLDSLPDTFESVALFREEIMLGVAKESRLAGSKSIAPDELAGESFILFGKGNYHLRELFLSLLESHGVKPDVVFESNLVGSIKSLVRNGTGISAFLKKVVTDEKGIKAVSVEPALFTEIGIAWKKGTYISRANRLFIDYLKKQ